MAKNDRVTVYYKGQLIYGTEPASGGRLSAEPTDSPLTLTALGNPVVGNQAIVEIRGATAQPIKLMLMDLNGKPLFEQQIERTILSQQLEILMSHQAVTFLFQATSATEQITIKLIRP